MRILSRKQLKELKGITYSNVHLHRLEKNNAFPQRIKLSAGQHGRIGWIEEEIDQWIRARSIERLRGRVLMSCAYANILNHMMNSFSRQDIL